MLRFIFNSVVIKSYAFITLLLPNDSRQNDFELLVSLNKDKRASGKLYWDDGESLNSIEDGQYQINTFELKNVAKFHYLLLIFKSLINFFFLLERIDAQSGERVQFMGRH